MKEIEEKDLLLIMTISKLLGKGLMVAGIEEAYRQSQKTLAEYRLEKAQQRPDK